MAKSRSELPLRGAEIPRFTLNKLRNLRDSPRGREPMPGPGKKALPYFLALEGRD
jgi:hypothetical protein